MPHIRRMLSDPDPGVRAAAIGALVDRQPRGRRIGLRARCLTDANPRIRATAAVVLAGSSVRRTSI